MQFNYKGTTIEEAKAAAMRELPGDAVVVFFVHGQTCAVFELTSKTLVPSLSTLGDTDGSVDFQFSAVPTFSSGYVYDPANVEFADVTVGLGQASAQSSCG